jgi:hypothetical protein
MSRQRAEGGFITELLPAREAGLPVKFIVSVMPEPGRSPSTLTPSKAADCETYDTLIERPKQAPVALLTDDSSWIYGKEENDRSLSHPAPKPDTTNQAPTVRSSPRLNSPTEKVDRQDR